MSERVIADQEISAIAMAQKYFETATIGALKKLQFCVNIPDSCTYLQFCAAITGSNITDWCLLTSSGSERKRQLDCDLMAYQFSLVLAI